MFFMKNKTINIFFLNAFRFIHSSCVIYQMVKHSMTMSGWAWSSWQCPRENHQHAMTLFRRYELNTMANHSRKKVNVISCIFTRISLGLAFLQTLLKNILVKHFVTPMVEGSVRGQPSLSTFPAGGNPGNQSTWKIPTTFDRALMDSLHSSSYLFADIELQLSKRFLKLVLTFWSYHFCHSF